MQQAGQNTKNLACPENVNTLAVPREIQSNPGIVVVGIGTIQASDPEGGVVAVDGDRRRMSRRSGAGNESRSEDVRRGTVETSGRASKARPLPKSGQARDSEKEGRVGLSHIQAFGCEYYQRADRKLEAGAKVPRPLHDQDDRRHLYAYTHTSAEAEREAALAVERAIYGDLFPVVPNIGNRNNSAALN